MNTNARSSIFTLFAAMLFYLNSHAAAAILTVDNRTVSAAHYQSLQAAHDAAADGDTLYVFPSGESYDAIAVAKKLFIYGTGFDLPDEDLFTTRIEGWMVFQEGSDGSLLEGFGGRFGVRIEANHIVLRRNYVEPLEVAESSVGILIVGNKILSGNPYSGQVYADPHYGIVCEADTEVIAKNNIILVRDYFDHMAFHTQNVLYLKNNVIINYADNPKYQSFGSHGLVVINNIFYHPTFCSSAFNGNIAHNISTGDVLPSGNIENVTMNELFESDFIIDSLDNRFHLKTGSPAIGSGMNGEDMGIYGGDTPFVDGGAPDLPFINRLDSRTVGSHQGGLDVTIEASSQAQ